MISNAVTAQVNLTVRSPTFHPRTYLAIAMEGFLDPRAVAVVLSAVPGMSDPGEVLGITPGAGQLVYSAMLPPETLAAVLDDSSGLHL